MLGFFSVLPPTYCSQLDFGGDAVLPGEAEDVRQVEGEVNDAAAGGSEVGLVEEDAYQEALHDGGNGEGQQEEEDKKGAAVIQHFSSLWEKNGDILNEVRVHMKEKVSDDVT